MQLEDRPCGYRPEPPCAEERFQAESVREVGRELIDLIRQLPHSDERDIAIGKIEEGVKWALQGIAE